MCEAAVYIPPARHVANTHATCTVRCASSAAHRPLRTIRALVKCDISKNGLFAEGTKLVARALKGNRRMTELNISGNRVTYDGSKLGEMSGGGAISDLIPTMESLTRLNVSQHWLQWCSGEDPSGVRATLVAMIHPPVQALSLLPSTTTGAS